MTSLPQNIPFKISASDPIGSINEAQQLVIGQLGQTLDGCIATPTGDSKYINSDCGLKHLHRIRSAVDAVIVGVGSVNVDNPKLNVRLCSGHHPTRVIIDPRGRINMKSNLFHDQGTEVVIITASEINHPAKDLAKIIKLKAQDFHIDPRSIINVLQRQGYKKILIEGGNTTLSKFIDASVIDRLHLIVAPVIMGGGLSGLNLSPIDKLNEALRPEVSLYPLGRDILYDCNFLDGAR